MGELAVSMLTAEGTIITQGFQQPAYTSLQEEALWLDDSFALYPNPATENVSYNFELTQPASIRVIIRDARGNVAREMTSEPGQLGKTLTSIDVSTLASGLYIISFQLLSDSGKTVSVMKRLIIQ